MTEIRGAYVGCRKQSMDADLKPPTAFPATPRKIGFSLKATDILHLVEIENQLVFFAFMFPTSRHSITVTIHPHQTLSSSAFAPLSPSTWRFSTLSLHPLSLPARFPAPSSQPLPQTANLTTSEPLVARPVVQRRQP